MFKEYMNAYRTNKRRFRNSYHIVDGIVLAILYVMVVAIIYGVQ